MIQQQQNRLLKTDSSRGHSIQRDDYKTRNDKKKKNTTHTKGSTTNNELTTTESSPYIGGQQPQPHGTATIKSKC